MDSVLGAGRPVFLALSANADSLRIRGLLVLGLVAFMLLAAAVSLLVAKRITRTRNAKELVDGSDAGTGTQSDWYSQLTQDEDL